MEEDVCRQFADPLHVRMCPKCLSVRRRRLMQNQGVGVGSSGCPLHPSNRYIACSICDRARELERNDLPSLVRPYSQHSTASVVSVDRGDMFIVLVDTHVERQLLMEQLKGIRNTSCEIDVSKLAFAHVRPDREAFRGDRDLRNCMTIAIAVDAAIAGGTIGGKRLTTKPKSHGDPVTPFSYLAEVYEQPWALHMRLDWASVLRMARGARNQRLIMSIHSNTTGKGHAFNLVTDYAGVAWMIDAQYWDRIEPFVGDAQLPAAYLKEFVAPDFQCIITNPGVPTYSAQGRRTSG
jgi:hypothetical protein